MRPASRMSSEIRVVSLDLDGTLVDKSYADYLWLELIPRIYAEEREIDLDAAKRLIYEQYDEVGPDRLEWYDLDYWLRRLGLGVSKEELLALTKPRVKVYPDALPALRILAEDHEIIIATNAHRDFVNLVFEACPELARLVVCAFSSVSDFNMPRKRREFYAKVCEALRAHPHMVLHVGDDPKYDYEEPRAAGLRAMLLDRAGRHPMVEARIASLAELAAQLSRHRGERKA